MRKGMWWLVGGVAVGGLAIAAARRRQALRAQRSRNSDIHVLILGAGVVGSTYAAHLARWGMDVTVLARGQRLQQITNQGLRVEDAITRRREVPRVHLVTAVSPEDSYDLVIVAVRYSQALEALDAVKPVADTSPVLILQNNPAGPELLAERLGERHLLMGFPGTGGRLTDGLVTSWPLWLSRTIVGESDGTDTQRLHLVASILRGAGLKIEVERHIVAWLQTHAAMIAALAACAYRNGGHVRRVAGNVQEARLYLGAVREAYAVLEANGIPLIPPAERKLLERPLPQQVALLRAAAYFPWASLLIDSHLAAAPEEMRALYDHIMLMAERANVSTPLLSSLAPFMRGE